MTPQPGRRALTPALWISVVPAFVAIFAIVNIGIAFHTSFAVLGWFGLLLLGLIPSITLTEMAEVELTRGTSVGRFFPRSLTLAGTFICSLLGASVIAFTIASIPTPLIWIILQVVATAPAATIATILMVRSHRLPIEPYTGPLVVFKRHQ